MTDATLSFDAPMETNVKRRTSQSGGQLIRNRSYAGPGSEYNLSSVARSATSNNVTRTRANTSLTSVRFTCYPCRPHLSMQRNEKFETVTRQNQTVNSVKNSGNIFLTAAKQVNPSHPPLLYMEPKTAA
eukprot:422186_1